MIFIETVKVTYNIGDLADWVSALATVAAVMVSLYLANRKEKPTILLEIINDDAITCRITNKSFTPIEFKIKIPGEKYYSHFPLPPMHEDIKDLKDSQPFNNDYIVFTFSPKQDVLIADGGDRISNGKYYFIFAQEHGKWIVRQYNSYLIWKIVFIWRKTYERFSKTIRG